MPTVGSAAGLRPQGTYSGSAYYQANDIVLYGPSTYLALQAVNGEAPDTSAKWQLIASGAASGFVYGQKWGTD